MKQILIEKKIKEPLLLDQKTDYEITILANSEVIIVDSDLTRNVKLKIKSNAIVNFYSLASQKEAKQYQAVLESNASVHWRSAVINTANLTILTIHQGDNSCSNHYGIYLGNDKHKINMDYQAKHQADYTSSHILVHGVLFNSAQADFLGNIIIDKTTKQTKGALVENTLLIDKASKCSSTPKLEIDTNDVSAKHSSCITKLNESQLFYLMSRGLDYQTSQRKVIDGFLSKVVSSFSNKKTQVRIKKIINQEINQAIALGIDL